MKKFEYAHVAEGIARKAGALLRGFYEKGLSRRSIRATSILLRRADRASRRR